MIYDAYITDLKSLLEKVECTGEKKNKFNLNQAMNLIIIKLKELKGKKQKIFWIGNGGSAAIANHSALDYFRTAEIKTQSFFDGPLLTCLGNDFGYDAVFQKPLSVYAKEGDMLVAISSSGKSFNIIKAVETAKEKKCLVVTMSGFKDDNPLKELGDFNFYVPKEHYGHVELVHGILCHSILDLYMLKEGK